MRLRIGYELRYQFPQPTPVILMLNVHDSRTCDLDKPDDIVIEPAVPISRYRDVFANQCSRILAPAGAMRISTDTVVRNTGLLRQRPAARSGMDPVRSVLPGMDARAGRL